MQLRLCLYSLFWMLITAIGQAQIWESNHDWNDEVESDYGQWINQQVSLDLFTNTSSPYHGIKTDCADLALTLRIIFSYERRLPFYIGSSASYHHLSRDFNHLGGTLRLKAFIDRINQNFASTHLAHHLTVPVAPSDIRPGDLYIYTDQGAHHTYVIQEIRSNGNMLLLYSTVPRKLRKIEVRIGMPAASFDAPPYGFRRFRYPQFFSLPLGKIPNLANNHHQQYQLVNQLGPTKALGEIKRILSKEPENIKQAIERRLHNSCTALRLRDELVNDTKSLFEKNGFRCLSQHEYSLYSTPLRDSVLFQEIAGLKNLWIKIVEKDLQPQSKALEAGLNYLADLPSNYSTEQGKKALNILCPTSAPIDLKAYLHHYQQGLISSLPYGPPGLRWGEIHLINDESSYWAKLQQCANYL